ncbi:hypothetical protein BJ138DRAFT_1162727 [Hygrophoropsis aurantiaca]|uniref:Uncharacterized protein n=1 Tax=Hygrophoropsis aurantiaca TaxID=72124 RepID=A0ACB8A085_9AGAM|nr:hypothetical protein BJ138DRAFT_1162727 [Hygrophoropsis aurantiaca]
MDDAALAAQLVGIQTARVFDYCITFKSEVRWVWGRTWDTTRIMFTIARYVTFVATFMTLYAPISRIYAMKPCILSASFLPKVTFLTSIVMLCLSYICEGLLILRTYAFWLGDRRILYGLLTLAAACIVGSVCISAFYLPNSPGQRLPSSPGCIFESSRRSAFQYIFLAIYESVLLGLTLYKRFMHYRVSTSSMILTLYRDGILYISCILLITLINVIIYAMVPIGYSNAMDAPQIVTHSLLASRILFNLWRNHAHILQRNSATNSFALNALIPRFAGHDNYEEEER